MKGTRHQEGYLYRKGSLWLLRYYDSEFAADGSVRRVQKTKKLAAVGPECKNKTAARDLARQFLESINLARNTPESAMSLIRFTEDRYLRFVEEHKRLSTFRGYRNMWRRYLKPRCDIMLREFRTADGERILDSIAKEHKLTSTTLAHIKAFLSGSFRFAKRYLDALAADVIVPLVTKAGSQWHGWHAFRRGLATNLHRLGVADKTIQRILRHANVAVTQACYIKTADSEVTAAMQQFERSLEYAPNMHLSGVQRPRLM